ncbi:ATP-binding cassette domain-containing protein [Corynebacterium aquilae]|uniref:ATP-binding cassette domain-containing protein n=1 Tax=Corynebacterium aquilae TaxID=203263 RepID=UPI00095210A1|nr:ATP-binding cassette domain-containing protein [Corynebacterium aquilae]
MGQLSPPPAVSMKHVRVRYDNAHHDVGIDIDELVIPAGARVALTGPSGSGKSTLAATIGGFLPTTATVSAESLQVSGRVGYVAQDSFGALNPLMRVENQIRLLGDTSILEQVGLSRDNAHKYPLELSGGQRQRAAIAFALASQPDIIIADEITSALDPVAIVDVLRALDHAAGNTTVIFISHHHGAARFLCDTAITLKKQPDSAIFTAHYGPIAAAGAPHDDH